MTCESSSLAALPDASGFNMLSAEIRACLREHHVVSLACVWQGRPWAASCFYAFEEASAALLVLSAEDTLHGMAMRASSIVAGTIAGQPATVREIRGLQFIADVQLLADEAADQAYEAYCVRHPTAKLRRSAVWRLLLQEVKFTSNAFLFANKTRWFRLAKQGAPCRNV